MVPRIMGEKNYFDGLREAQISKYRELMLEFLEEARRTPGRTIFIVYLPSAENTIAASILASSLEASGIRVVSYPSHNAPSTPSIPAVYINVEPKGLGNELYVGGKPPSHASRSIRVENGLPSLLVLLLGEIAPLNDYARLAAIASAYIMGRDKGERRDLVGFDREAAAKARDIGRKFTLLAYRVEREPLASSLARTLLPYYPGLTGSEESTRRVLREVSIDPDAVYSRIEDRDTISSLLNLLIDLVSKEYQSRPRDPRSLIAGINYYHLGSHILWDARELAVVLEASHYSWGPEQIMLYTMLEAERRVYREYLARLLPRVVELVEDARTKPGTLRETRLAGRKAWIHVGADIGDPLTIAAQALRMMGVIEGNKPVIAGKTPVIPVDEALRTGLWPLPDECASSHALRGSWIKIGECLED